MIANYEKFRQWWSTIPSISTKQRKVKQCWSAIPSISTKNKESLNSDGQQFHQYHQNKERLKSYGQQFHQYQHSKQSPLILTQWPQQIKWHMTMEIQVRIGTGSINVARFNRSKGSKPSALAKDNPNYHVPNSLFRYVLIRYAWRGHS